MTSDKVWEALNDIRALLDRIVADLHKADLQEREAETDRHLDDRDRRLREEWICSC